MRYRSLGKTGLTVSEVGFGAWSISGGGRAYGPTDDHESLAAIRRAYELGVTFFDTADIYGNGHSERLIARALKGVRHKVIIATKVGYDFYQGERKEGPIFYRGEVEKNFSGEYILSAAEKSLERLETDSIDLYQLHNPSLTDLRKGQCLDAMERLREKGKIRFYGVSVTTAEEARCVMEKTGASTLQLVHNILRPQILRAIEGDVKKHGMGIIVRTPMEYGLLAGRWTPETNFPEGDHRHERWSRSELRALLAKVEGLQFLVKGETKSLGQAALRFILSSEVVSTVIPGVKRPSQVEENVAASGPPYLSRDDMERIDKRHV